MDYLGGDLHNGQPATERAVGCVGKAGAMQRRGRREREGKRNGREKGGREREGGRKEGLNCAAGSSLPTNRVPPCASLCHAYCTQTTHKTLPTHVKCQIL